MHVSIIIPYFNNKDTIKNCIRSVQAQDYKNYDIIVVEDGEQEIDREAIKKEFGVKWVVQKENKGAAAARNLGAKQQGVLAAANPGAKQASKPDILFFLDADCMLYPGMLRECVTQLELNKDIDFVYGNYRFEAEHGTHHPEFDAYTLESYNYISTMSPMRKKVFDEIGGFNEDLKFFQDWDFFYRATKKGFKGKLINEFIFTTPLPTEKSISGSKGMTLSEKALKFRELHKIKKDILSVSTGAPFQALQRAKVLGADYLPALGDNKGNAFLQYDYGWKATYLTGFYNSDPRQITNHLNLIIGKPIIQFIGTDVYDLITQHSVKELQMIKKIFEEKKAIILANSPRLVRELADAGIKAKLLYAPLYNIDQYKPKPLPKKPTVAVYCADSPNMNGLDGELTYLPLILEIAKGMPDIHFKFFGSMRKERVIDHIEMCGKINPEDMPEFINSCSMILRFTRHDGFPQLPIQFLLCGRKALVSCPDDEMKYADKIGFEELALTDYEENKLGMPSQETAKGIIMGKIYECLDKAYDNSMDKDGWKNWSAGTLSELAHKYYGVLMSESHFNKVILNAMDGLY